jgi:hypothetical protein
MNDGSVGLRDDEPRPEDPAQGCGLHAELDRPLAGVGFRDGVRQDDRFRRVGTNFRSLAILGRAGGGQQGSNAEQSLHLDCPSTFLDE